MADDEPGAKPDQPDKPEPDKPEPDKPEPDKPDTPANPDPQDPEAALLEGARDPDAVRNAIQREREAAKEAKKRADAAEAKVKQFEDRDKSEQEKLEERAASEAERANTAEQSYLRLKVGTDKGLPAGLSERLQGSSEEEMAEDADRLLEAMKQNGGQAPNLDGGARQPAPGGASMNDLIRQSAGRPT